jgi:hypothetical protein
MAAYRLVRHAPLDRHSTVAFRLPAPADAHEAMLTLTMSRGAWEAQEQPGEITVTMTVVRIDG